MEIMRQTGGVLLIAIMLTLLAISSPTEVFAFDKKRQRGICLTPINGSLQMVDCIKIVKHEFLCRTTGCVVRIKCRHTVLCRAKITVSVLRRGSSDKAIPRIVLTSKMTNIPPGRMKIVRSKLTNRGKRFLRSNRNKTVNAVTDIIDMSNMGAFITNTPVKITLK